MLGFAAGLVQRTQDGLADDLCLVGAADAAVARAIADHHGPFLAPLHQKGLNLDAFRIDHRLIGHGGAQQAGMMIRLIIDRVEGSGDALFQRLARAAMCTDMGIQLLPRILDEGHETGAFVRVMQIKRAVAEPCFARDVLRPCRIIAALDE